MLNTSIQKFKEDGVSALDHQLTLDGVVLLEIEEYADPEPHYALSWPTNFSGAEGYKLVLEMYMALKKNHPNPEVTYSMRKTHQGVPLEQFLKETPRLNLNRLWLFRIDAWDENNDGTAIVYDRMEQSQGLISNYDLSHIIPPFLKRSSPFAEKIDEKEIEAKLHGILSKYKQLSSQ